MPGRLFDTLLRGHPIKYIAQKFRRERVWRWYARNCAPKSYSIRPGDVVQVTEGVEKGKKGVVATLRKKEGRLIVKGVNMRRRIKVADNGEKQGLYHRASAIHYSRVALVDPVLKVPTRIKWARVPAREGAPIQMNRISVASGAVLPLPPTTAVQLLGVKDAKLHPLLDAPEDMVKEVTYVPIDWTRFVSADQLSKASEEKKEDAVKRRSGDTATFQYEKKRWKKYNRQVITAFEVIDKEIVERKGKGEEEWKILNDPKIREMAALAYKL